MSKVSRKFKCELCGNKYEHTKLHPLTHYIEEDPVDCCTVCYMLFKIQKDLTNIKELLNE